MGRETYEGRLIAVSFGDYKNRIGIDATLGFYYRTIKSSFQLKTKRTLKLEYVQKCSALVGHCWSCVKVSSMVVTIYVFNLLDSISFTLRTDY